MSPHAGQGYARIPWSNRWSAVRSIGVRTYFSSLLIKITSTPEKPNPSTGPSSCLTTTSSSPASKTRRGARRNPANSSASSTSQRFPLQPTQTGAVPPQSIECLNCQLISHNTDLVTLTFPSKSGLTMEILSVVMHGEPFDSKTERGFKDIAMFGSEMTKATMDLKQRSKKM